MAKKKGLEKKVVEASEETGKQANVSERPGDGRTFQKRIKAHMGRNLPKMLSRSLVKSPYDAVGELVRNSYDEDATEVHVDTDDEKGTFTITDNGIGMDKRGLANFFRLAGSYKGDEPISPKGRKRIGKFGIAKVLLEYLGNSFSIESFHSRKRYVIDEGTEHEPEVYALPSRDNRSGTRIVIRDLNFDIGRDGIDLYRLYCKLQWEIPDCKDIDVFVNGKLVRKRSGLKEYAGVYRFSERVGKKKNEVVHGTIYAYRPNNPKSRDLEGVKLCVNGVAIGEGSFVNLGTVDWRLEGKVQGEINADFLEDQITLNRRRVKDSPMLERIKQEVIKVLRSICSDYDYGQARRGYYTQERKLPGIESAIDLAQEQLAARLGEDYELKFGSNGKAGAVARFHPNTKTIYINPNCRIFCFGSDCRGSRRRESEIYLRRAFLTAAAHAIAKHSANAPEDLSDFVAGQGEHFFSSFEGIGNIVAKVMEGQGLIPLAQIYFSPYRYYDHYEASHMTGRPSNVFRLLHTSGALKGDEEHLFPSLELQKTLADLEGYTSCVEIAEPAYAQVNLQCGGLIKVLYDNPKATSVDSFLAGVRDKRGMDIKDVGTVHPLHFVRTEQRDRFLEFLKSGGYNG